MVQVFNLGSCIAFSYWVSLGSFSLEWFLSLSFITLTFWEEYILLIAAQFGFTECTLMIRFRYCVSGRNAELVGCPLCIIPGITVMPVGPIIVAGCYYFDHLV